MRHLLPTLAVAGGLAGCANLNERPFALGTAGLDADEVLRVERANLEAAHPDSPVRRRMSAIEAVEGLRCVTLRRMTASTPRCDYRLRYRRPDGSGATRMKRRQYFERGDDGRWESVFIVTGA